ncbi:MAG: oligosaccharide repeat unit polymerase [Bacteroidetes bacterium]|nr:oligosaccharide repeat unit polymerase [Bacteroidota bacterium]
MTVISIICFFICLLVILDCLRSSADILSPARVFGFIWLLALGLAEFKLSKLQHEWTSESWFLLLIGPAAFLVGLYIAYILNIGSPQTPISRMRNQVLAQSINLTRLFWLIVVLFVLFIVGYASIVLIGREVPLFADKPGAARVKFQIFGLGLFLHNVILITIFSLIYCLADKEHKLRKRLLIILSLVSSLMYIVTMQRFQILMIIIIGLIFLYYSTRYLRLSAVVPILLIAVLFFYWISTWRGGELFIYWLYLTSKMKFSQDYAIFTEPYMYLVMNLENYSRSLSRLESFSFGYYTFDFVVALTGMKHWLAEYFTLDDTPYLISGYNTYSTFWWFYRDYGILGITFIPLLSGMVTGWIYYLMRRISSLGWTLSYCVALFLILFSFYNNMISYLWFFYNIVGLYFGYKIINKKNITT